MRHSQELPSRLRVVTCPARSARPVRRYGRRRRVLLRCWPASRTWWKSRPVDRQRRSPRTRPPGCGERVTWAAVQGPGHLAWGLASGLLAYGVGFAAPAWWGYRRDDHGKERLKCSIQHQPRSPLPCRPERPAAGRPAAASASPSGGLPGRRRAHPGRPWPPGRVAGGRGALQGRCVAQADHLGISFGWTTITLAWVTGAPGRVGRPLRAGGPADRGPGRSRRAVGRWQVGGPHSNCPCRVANAVPMARRGDGPAAPPGQAIDRERRSWVRMAAERPIPTPPQ